MPQRRGPRASAGGVTNAGVAYGRGPERGVRESGRPTSRSSSVSGRPAA